MGSATYTGASQQVIRSVIVGFDGSASAGAALEWAIDEARLHAVPLRVCIAADVPDVIHVRACAERIVAGRNAEPGGKVRADFRVDPGAAAEVLCDACGAGDLLVVGSRGRNPVAGLLLGSVSAACLARAPCSVVVVRPAPRSPRPHGRVIVGVDTSTPARRALHVAACEALRRRAELDVIHAVQWDRLLDPQLIVPATRQLVSWTTEVVDHEQRESGISGHPLVVNGDPADVLVRHSAKADLLVLGSSGHGALATLAAGSTSGYCARHAVCPVMVVRPDPEGHASS